MTFPTTVDFNDVLNLFLAQLTPFVEELNTFMHSTEPYNITCHRKKVFFLLFLETTFVFAFLYETRRAKHLAVTYLPLKLIALNVTVSPLSGFWLFAA